MEENQHNIDPLSAQQPSTDSVAPAEQQHHKKNKYAYYCYYCDRVSLRRHCY